MKSNILTKLYKYQKKRFPLVVLSFTTISVVLSSAIVISENVSRAVIINSFLATLLYLFHIRIIDEIRDYNHDSKFHKNRPIQKGIITLKELKLANTFGMLIFFIIAFFYGKDTIALSFILLSYSFLALKDFFLNEKIRKKFFLYNSINIIQMLILQLFLYSFFTNNFTFNIIIILHLMFVFINFVIIEVMRKIKIPKKESIGKDTYSWHFGFRKSLFVYWIIILINAVIFYYISKVLNIINSYWYCLSSAILLLLFFSILYFHKSKKGEGLFQLATLIMYLGFNFIIYFSK